MKNQSNRKRSILQLSRLETLTDVVYGIVIWRLFMLIPRPGVGESHWESLRSYMGANVLTLVLLLVGLIVTIIYWMQSNALFGNLEKTDGIHTGLSIFQLFFLLIFLYSLRLGVDAGSSPATRAFESSAAALVGIASSLAWFYAIKSRRLLAAEMSDQEARGLAHRVLAEPIAAFITLPCAFIGPILWEISWLSYLPVVFLLNRRKPRRTS